MNNEELYRKILESENKSDKERKTDMLNLLNIQAKAINMEYLFITKEDVLNKNLKVAERFFKKIDKKWDKFNERVFIVFDGWDNDNRELYEINEVREYVQLMVSKQPHLLFYLSQLTETLQIVLSCLSNNLTSIKPSNLKTAVETIKENEHRLNDLNYLEISKPIMIHFKMDESYVSDMVFRIYNFFVDKGNIEIANELINRILNLTKNK